MTSRRDRVERSLLACNLRLGRLPAADPRRAFPISVKMVVSCFA